MKRPILQCRHYLPTLGLLVWALAALLAKQGIGLAAAVPPIGTMLTNSVQQADGSLVTKRYRVTTSLLSRDAQVGTRDVDRRAFGASLNGASSGTFISDLPSKAMLIGSSGLVVMIGESSRADSWPDAIDPVYLVVTKRSDFLRHGSKSFVASPVSGTYFSIPLPIGHPSVAISYRLDTLHNVSIQLTPDLVASAQGHRYGEYVIVDGNDVVVSFGIPAFTGDYGGAIIGSSLAASGSAHGVAMSYKVVGEVENHPQYLENPMYNICWGAEFVGVEEVTDMVPSVTLTGRMVATGFEVSFLPIVPVASQLEYSATLPGTWSPMEDVPAGAASVIVATAKMPNASAFFRLSAKP